MILYFFKKNHKITVLTSDYFKLNHKVCFYYGQKLASINYAKNRKNYQKIVSSLLQNIPFNQLFHTRLTIFLTYHYFIYADLYQIILEKTKPDIVVTLSNSYHEQTARFIAEFKNIKTKKLHFLTFIKLNHWLKNFFLNREYRQKIKNFLAQSKKPKPDNSKLKKAVFLSLDFHRHLKTLAPIYLKLAKLKHNPWLVTDIPNLDSTISNLRMENSHVVYLASFLPKKYQLTQKSLNIKPVSITDLSSFLYNLSLKTIKPIIKHSLILQDLYLKSANNLFRSTNPKSLVVVSDTRYCELALAKQAKKDKIFSLLVSPNTLLGLAKLNPYDTTDKVALVGSFIKQQLINQGLDSNKLEVVGDPRIENYQSLKKSLSKSTIYQAFGLKSNKKIALLISFRSTWMIPKHEKKAFFQMAATAIKKTPNTVLIVKPHPTEKRYRVLKELKEWRIKNAIVSDNSDLELVSLLSVSSVVLQTWSMTIFEAIMMNRPVISINPFNKDYNFFIPILKQGGAIEVHSQKELNTWLKILLNSKHIKTKKQLQSARKASSDFIKPPDGKVTERIMQLLFQG